MNDPLYARAEWLLAQAATGRGGTACLAGLEFVKELGRGGMGAVFLLRNVQTGAFQALKLMLPGTHEGACERTQHFLREIANMQSLVHPNIVRLYSAGYLDDVIFFTLEYCPGGSVDRLMAMRGGVLDLQEALSITLQTLAGLEYAHTAEIPNVPIPDGTYATGRGLVHRDLKPHNIFLSGMEGNWTAKIGDYGLAKAFELAGLSGVTRTGSASGTPYFMPRQQVVNFKYAKPEVDVWACAASLYYMLTGEFPRDFSQGANPWQIILQKAPVPIRSRSSIIPERLAGVIDEALSDTFTLRFRDAGELRRALQNALEGEE